jgi:hypothetical protein
MPKAQVTPRTLKSLAQLVAEYEKRMAEVLAAENARRTAASDKARLRAQRLAQEIVPGTDDPPGAKRRK